MEEFPSLLQLKSNKDYIRKVMESVRLTGLKESMVDVSKLTEDADFFSYQNTINKDVGKVASHAVIDKYIKEYGEDYRYEDKPNVEKALRDRKQDNTELARKKSV